jgi:PAS domain S-box-containing protein
MFGGTKEEIIDKTPQYFSPKRQPDGMDSEEKAHQLLKLAMDGIPQRFEWLHTRIDGGLFFADVSLYRMELSGETLLVAAVRDISEKKRLEKEVYMSYITGEENERTRIAKELHDGLGPLLSACKIYHYNLGKDRLNADDLESYQKMGNMLTESMISIKEISNNLSPHVLRNFGLIVAVKNFKENIRTDIKFFIECQCDESKRYDEVFEITLYRVLTELIHNSIKHAGASEIGIRMEELNNVFIVNFHDNGKGFDFDEALKKSGGLGLLNIQSRIHSLGGEIGFQSRKEGGVSVTISINL